LVIISSVDLVRAAASASTASGPVLPGVSTPLEDFDGAVQVGGWVTRSISTTARSPVKAVHLPDSNIPLVRSTLRILVHSVSISTGFVADDALAVSLVPSAVFSAPRGNIHLVCIATTRARVTATRAVSAASASGGGIEITSTDHSNEDAQHNNNKYEAVHFLS